MQKNTQSAKKFSLTFRAVFFLALTLLGFNQALAKSVVPPTTRQLVFHTETVGGKTHWMPEKLDVTAGETLVLIFQHNLATGPDFHGVLIPEFKLTEKIMRSKEARFNVTVPADIAEKEIMIKCQFHPAHQPAHLNVLSKPKK